MIFVCHLFACSSSILVSLNRTVLLKLASIAVLMITLYVQVEKRCNEDEDTCCQQVNTNEATKFFHACIRPASKAIALIAVISGCNT